MFQPTVNNVLVELCEIMDRIECVTKESRTATEQQKVSAIAARDYIYVGYIKLKECLEDKNVSKK